MADEPRRNPILSPAPLIALALLAAGVIVKNIPLESPRPADAERRKTTIVGQQNVEGRLWQDPFVAVDAEIVSIARELGIASGSVRRPRQAAELANLASRDESHRLQGARDAIAAAVAAGNQVMLVGAMVFGGSYPEDTENRRRNRMALVSGLIASGFAPDDADHLGYFWTEAAAGVTLPKVYDPESNQSWTRTRAAYLPTDLIGRLTTL